MPRTALPVVVLTILGALVTILGLFAAGNIAIVIVGLVALFGAGLLSVLDQRTA